MEKFHEMEISALVGIVAFIITVIVVPLIKGKFNAIDKRIDQLWKQSDKIKDNYTQIHIDIAEIKRDIKHISQFVCKK